MAYEVTQVPLLPDGFTDTFTSRRVTANGVELHAVVGGDGPPLLLLPGWPQFWFAWREAMTPLASRHTVVAADLRGMGGSDKPERGYDVATLAADMAALMTELGHDRFAVAGYDLGMLVAYTLAADEPRRVTHLIAAESILPGLSPAPPLFMEPEADEFLWHFVFNRLAEVNDRMVAGREEIYFGHQFVSKTAVTPPQEVVDVYVDHLREPAARRASFEYYRARESMAQVVQRSSITLEMPVLAIGGEHSSGDRVRSELQQVAVDVTGAVLPGTGHFVADESPQALAELVLDFLRRRS